MFKSVNYQQSYDFWIGGFLHCKPEVIFPWEPGYTQTWLMITTFEVSTRVTCGGHHSICSRLTSWSFSNSLYRIVAWALTVKLFSHECHRTLPIKIGWATHSEISYYVALCYSSAWLYINSSSNHHPIWQFGTATSIDQCSPNGVYHARHGPWRAPYNYTRSTTVSHGMQPVAIMGCKCSPCITLNNAAPLSVPRLIVFVWLSTLSIFYI